MSFASYCLFDILKVIKSMQKQELKQSEPNSSPRNPNREITYITNSQNTERAYGQPSEQLFPKRWSLSNRNRTKNNMNTRKVKRHRNSDTKTGYRVPQQIYRIRTVSNELLVCVCVFLWGGGLKLVLRAQPHPQFLKWYKNI